MRTNLKQLLTQAPDIKPLYLDLYSLTRAFEKVTTVCVEVLWTQPLVVEGAEQT